MVCFNDIFKNMSKICHISMFKYLYIYIYERGSLGYQMTISYKYYANWQPELKNFEQHKTFK